MAQRGLPYEYEIEEGDISVAVKAKRRMPQ